MSIYQLSENRAVGQATAVNCQSEVKTATATSPRHRRTCFVVYSYENLLASVGISVHFQSTMLLYTSLWNDRVAGFITGVY